jgi:hypothetical protein
MVFQTPPPAQTMTREMLVSLLSATLEHTFCQGTAVRALDDGKTHKSTFMFQCKTVPVITVNQYFQRLAKYTGVSGEAMVCSLFCELLRQPSATNHVATFADSVNGPHCSYLSSFAKFPGQHPHNSSLDHHQVIDLFCHICSLPRSSCISNVVCVYVCRSVLVSAKFFDDDFLTNARYARIGGG